MILDKHNNEVKIGSWIKVLFIEPDFISSFSENEGEIIKSMINKAFEVSEVKDGKALVYQPFDRFSGFTLALESNEIEISLK